jgi:hypothetical protein
MIMPTKQPISALNSVGKVDCVSSFVAKVVLKRY